MSKTCRRCGLELPLEAFGIEAAGVLGRKAKCKECLSKRLTASLDDFPAMLDLIGAGPAQVQAVEALERHGSIQLAAEDLGIGESTLRFRLAEIERQASRRGWSPKDDMTQPVPAGFHVKGVSTYYGKDGEVKGQWVKSQADQEHKLAALLDALRDLAEPYKGTSDAPPTRAGGVDDLLCVYPMGDPHIGMFAWAEETGEDFDLKIAERTLTDAVDNLVSLAPQAKEALIINLGDFYHSDTPANRTTRSGNTLDVDTRWAKVLRAGIRTFRRCIDRALEKHERVTVICEIGNHDDMSSVMLATCLDQYYENDPRVTIDTSPSTFHWYRFGANLIGVTHGNNTKAADLPGIMACDRPLDWGDTQHRFWYTGHVHHDTLKEFRGCVVETFRTLAARDAWHHSQGYRSGRDMKLDVLHRTEGRIQRHVVGIEKLRRKA